jgi:hypothetical protein
VTIKHREFVAILAGNTFSNTLDTYPINPGMAKSFPWLSGIAMSFESYHIKAFKAEVVSRCAADKSGAYAMAFDYDSYDAKPTIMSDIYSMAGSVQAPYWKGAECKLHPGLINQYGKKFMRDGIPPGDLNKYDAANFIVAHNGDVVSQAACLYFTYVIDFYCPQKASTNVPEPQNVAQFNLAAPKSLLKDPPTCSMSPRKSSINLELPILLEPSSSQLVIGTLL